MSNTVEIELHDATIADKVIRDMFSHAIDKNLSHSTLIVFDLWCDALDFVDHMEKTHSIILTVNE